MNRRQALRNIGLGAGVMVVGPSTLSLLQSCKSEPSYDWQPIYLTASNGFILKEVLEIILPKTDTAGASELNIAEFIDSYMNEVAPESQQKDFKKSADAFASAFEKQFDKNPGNGTAEEYDQIIAKYLKATSEEKESFRPKRTTETQDPQDKDPEEELEMNHDSGALAYLETVRDMGIWAWQTSEQIGENVLWYDPIPGKYIPCGPVEELGGGKAMSL
ncbi:MULTISPECIES: gluconate 2-dehydrogenase subunit 3 family protein [unclassified Zunongwangia]|uniref:gluconate 2-dehydrogenase subunit 3 family protein n=1 Tax=unclassified Zunongwangia TaxID=2632541 RepID=UPI0022DE6F55|nr:MULTISPECIES: gluconate 2-dehydrogenase subunit 3 family protein [unclassified Zunongwangia]WBL21008.1 gluconate 2-dehydrogenase subunit 3 family protein [Zunongwangia sp. HRR-M8]WBL27118.1 gluconate 2-dehydrogenase subunit 3 family protein [Zunongwangia sp. HGR-M22]